MGIFIFQKRVEGRGELVLIGQRIALCRWQRVVRVRRHGHRGIGLPEGVPDGVVVAAAADEDPDRWIVGSEPELVVDDGNIEAELAGVLGLEFSGLELDDDVTELDDVEEQQVEVEVVPAHVEVHLPADEREAGAEFPQGFDDAIHQRLFQVPLGGLIGQLEEVEDVGVFRDLLRELRLGSGELPGEVGGTGSDAFVGAVHDLVHQHVP